MGLYLFTVQCFHFGGGVQMPANIDKAVIVMVGNLTVIISISHFKQLHSPTNFLILSMATVDFLLGFFIMPCSMVRSVEHCWCFGEFFCKIHTSMDIMLSTASIFHLSFISIDRYYAVCDPLRYKSKINTFVIVVMQELMLPSELPLDNSCFRRKFKLPHPGLTVLQYFVEYLSLPNHDFIQTLELTPGEVLV
ncbi:Trace amine-associated receptor 1 [Lonchura striata]|uniref:Trace amine-associated receptor 1 n=1 Tax=Lonchura striata TaxID=40157 RepID=A0A218V872_9PASE|nr:Trace amine-associated receptor 1 [Lonchura striata domestica]